MAYDSATSQLVLFGGYEGHQTVLNDTWTYNGTTWTQQFPTTSPPALQFPSLAYDSAISQLVVFGEFPVNGTETSETWTYNGTTWTQQFPTTSPPPRSQPSMAYDSAISQLVLFGGTTANGNLGDTWTYSGTTWTKRSPATSPPAQLDASMVFDATTSQMVLLSTYGTTWTYNGTTWTRQSPATSPPARSGASMVYDSGSGDVVVFGGVPPQSDTDLTDTWTYDGSTWTDQSPATGPSGRTWASIGYDPGSGQVVLFGGSNVTGYADADTWTLAPLPAAAPTVTTQPTNQSETPGQTATFTTAASGNPTPTVVWQYSTDGGSTWSTVPGNATSPTLSGVVLGTFEDGWKFRAVFTNTAGSATTNSATLTVP